MANKNQNDLYAKIITRAWKDQKFKAKLLSNPRAAFKEMGLEIPENIQVKVVEERPNSFTFVLPMPGAGIGEMSDQELEKLVAGAGLGTALRTAYTIFTC